jgi:hypothetical protein
MHRWKSFSCKITKTATNGCLAIVEAVAPAVNCVATLKLLFTGLKHEKELAAKVATGRRLLTIIYRVLRRAVL